MYPERNDGLVFEKCQEKQGEAVFSKMMSGKEELVEQQNLKIDQDEENKFDIDPYYVKDIVD